MAAQTKDTAEAVVPPAMGVAPPIVAHTVTPSKDAPVVLATPLTQALSLPDLGEGGTVITSDGVALSRADARTALEAAAACGVDLIDKTPASPEKRKGES